MSVTGPAAQTLRDIIEGNRYLVLATADAAGWPWSSPVYFAHIGFSEFFWISSPDVTHSRNIAVRPEVGIVVFDSQMPINAPSRRARCRHARRDATVPSAVRADQGLSVGLRTRGHPDVYAHSDGWRSASPR